MSATKLKQSAGSTNGRIAADTPIRPQRVTILDSGDKSFLATLMMATPSRGLVRIEWHAAVRGMMVPPNYSMVSMSQRIHEMFPIRFSVADAQNLVVREALGRDFEWVLLLEDDVMPPTNLLVGLRQYLKNGPPVVSGLYYTKSQPSEPLIYRGRGTGAYLDWKRGQKVWCDGVPTGCLLIHSALLRAMWDESPEYTIGFSGQRTRAVFETPTRSWVGPEGDINTEMGTSDLEWCKRVIQGDYLRKSGWGKFARRKYPFLVDTNLFCKHISHDGTVFPPPD